MVGAVLELWSIMQEPQMDKFKLLLAAILWAYSWDILIPQLAHDDFDLVGPYPFSYYHSAFSY